MTWIETIDFDAADGELKTLYKKIKGPGGHIDNILTAHSLRPHTLAGHMALYKRVLHHKDNALPKWFLEAIGVAVSLANKCDYCVEHHRAGLKRALGDTKKFAAIDKALADRRYDDAFDTLQAQLLGYALRLSENPASISQADIRALRRSGASDGDILEVNQVSAYFAYANRTVLGLGVETSGEPLGQSPAGSATDDWRHR